MMDTSLRNRKTSQRPLSQIDEKDNISNDKRKAISDDDDQIVHGISVMDILRVLSGAIVLSCLLSWFITDGDSFTWGYRPRISRWRTIKALFQPAVNLTESELSLYNGQDPDKPIYVAVNGSVFDVSANRLTYGPMGGYHFFAGRDAARAFVTGCFQSDLTWDLRGLEEKYIVGDERKIDDKEADEIERLESSHGSLINLDTDDPETLKTQGRIRYLKRRREKRRREAWKQVEKAVSHWDSFFRNHDRYFYVGTVVHDHASLVGQPVPELCGGKDKPS